MHLLRTTTRFLDEQDQAVDLGQSPADMLFLSFSDSDLGLAAEACNTASNLTARLASLAMLKHPYSVDLHIESVGQRAKFVLVRLLGGLDYWRYGAEQLADAARTHGFDLAIVPGDHQQDPRLDELSTLPGDLLHRIWAHFQVGGAENLSRLFCWVDRRLTGSDDELFPPAETANCGFFHPASRDAGADDPLAAIIIYRSHVMAGNTAAITALADALSARRFRVRALFVASLKEPDSASFIQEFLQAEQPDVVLNTTAFASRLDGGDSPLDAADAPVFQVMLAGTSEAGWTNNPRGLSAADLAMNVVLPELDGRIISRAISFKEQTDHNGLLEFTNLVQKPQKSRVDFVADLASNWARLRRTPKSGRILACVLSDYPAKGGREGYAVGLDTPNSVVSITATLSEAGYSVDPIVDGAVLMQRLCHGPADGTLSLDHYRAHFAELPTEFQATVRDRWGDPADDPALHHDGFSFRIVRTGKLLIALQPDRAGFDTRKTDYHDGALPPRHAYIAFYLWLRHVERIDALIHLGTHGTLEWLPGKTVALSEGCAPEILLGPTPLIYPFIVNNPGEAAQAKRRTAAVTIGHLTPPLTLATSHGALLEIEELFDEYAAAEQLDPSRARLIAQTILDRAAETGLAQDSGMTASSDPQAALMKLDGWLCDIKEMRIGDGLHVFGQSSTAPNLLDGLEADHDAAWRLGQCGPCEREGLLKALDGGFVAPGPSGAPSRGRLDVLPTGRNLFTIDPRIIPTRTAWEIGKRAAAAIVARYLQDHGDWPKRLVMDLWASATMRTGGEEFAQALTLLGLCPIRDQGSSRVTGFKILPAASLDGPRIDVTLRISGLFRDVFPAQIALFNQVVREVASLDEDDEINPLAAAARADAGITPFRIFGAAPGSYGTGLSRMIAKDGTTSRASLGAAYMAATSHAHGAEAAEAGNAFRLRVANADLFVHVQDIAGQDILDSDAFAEHEGGFAAAAASLGATPAVYHLDATRTDQSVVRTLPEEMARIVRGRASNPRWIAGQMRHGHRGAAEIAETVDNLFAFAALTDAVSSRYFDLVFDATLGQDPVRDFLLEANPAAAGAIADRFSLALSRGFWQSQRNSVTARLAEIQAVLS